MRRGGHSLREIAMIKIADAPPFKSRVPMTAWAFAGLVTLFSIGSSLSHVALSSSAVADQGKEPRAHHASVN
jgi:hypothetical protein